LRAAKKSIDYAMLERTKLAAVMPADFGWSDVGSWSWVLDVMDRDAAGNATDSPVVVMNSRNGRVHADESVLTTVVGTERSGRAWARVGELPTPRPPRHQRGEVVLAKLFCSGGPFRQSQIPLHCRAIPNVYLYVIPQLGPEFAKQAARINHRTRAITCRLVPDWRKAKNRPPITGAQGANQQVVCFGRILHDP
jgi:hypothetical protein